MFKQTGMYTPDTKPSLELFLASMTPEGSPLSSGEVGFVSRGYISR